MSDTEESKPESSAKIVFKKSGRKNLRQRKNSDDEEKEEQYVTKILKN